MEIGPMGDEKRFELEDDAPAASLPPPASPAAPAAPSTAFTGPPAPRRATAVSTRVIRSEPLEPESAFWSRFPARFHRRLKRSVLAFAVGFLVLGWLCTTAISWALPAIGALVGVFAAYRRSDEVLLGGVSAAAGYAACAAALHGPPVGLSALAVIGLFAGLGALMAIDDRLGDSRLLAAGDDARKSGKP